MNTSSDYDRMLEKLISIDEYINSLRNECIMIQEKIPDVYDYFRDEGDIIELANGIGRNCNEICAELDELINIKTLMREEILCVEKEKKYM